VYVAPTMTSPHPYPAAALLAAALLLAPAVSAQVRPSGRPVALPGIPVWQLGPETRWPGLAFVVFPGNVGGSDALCQLVTMLR